MFFSHHPLPHFLTFAGQSPINGDHDGHAAAGGAGDSINLGRLRLDDPINRIERFITKTAVLLHNLDSRDPMTPDRDLYLGGNEKIAKTASIYAVSDLCEINRLDTVILVFDIAAHGLETEKEDSDKTNDNNQNNGQDDSDLF